MKKKTHANEERRWVPGQRFSSSSNDVDIPSHLGYLPPCPTLQARGRALVSDADLTRTRSSCGEDVPAKDEGNARMALRKSSRMVSSRPTFWVCRTAGLKGPSGASSINLDWRLSTEWEVVQDGAHRTLRGLG